MTQVKILTDAERLMEAKRLGDEKALSDAEAYRIQHEFTGGFLKEKKSCHHCTYFKLGGHAGAYCKNPAANLKGTDLKRAGLRLDHGLCGPNGVFFEKNNTKRNKSLATGAIIGGVLGLIIGSVFLWGWMPVAVVLGIIVFLGVMSD